MKKKIFIIPIILILSMGASGPPYQKKRKEKMSSHIRIFLAGDVMLGRGVDQILENPSPPKIYESYVKDARNYVDLAVQKNGPLPKDRAIDYIWGYAKSEFNYHQPDVKIINLETAVTKNEDFWKGKGINYRMNPKNVPVLTSVKIDVCSLANNHVLDWGHDGLKETVSSLRKAGIKISGTGTNISEAQEPAIVEVPNKGRILIFSFGSGSSGVPYNWKATESRPGIAFLVFQDKEINQIKHLVKKFKRENDVVVFSVHWGPNWGWQIPSSHVEFAHRLIDETGIDLIFGHSSHHIKGIEIYKDKLIIYGAGDLIDDYEGIMAPQSNEYRDDLGLLYFVDLDVKSGVLVKAQFTPTQIKNIRVNKPSKSDINWLENTLKRESKKFGTVITRENDRFILTPGNKKR